MRCLSDVCSERGGADGEKKPFDETRIVTIDIVRFREKSGIVLPRANHLEAGVDRKVSGSVSIPSSASEDPSQPVGGADSLPWAAGERVPEPAGVDRPIIDPNAVDLDDRHEIAHLGTESTGRVGIDIDPTRGRPGLVGDVLDNLPGFDAQVAPCALVKNDSGRGAAGLDRGPIRHAPTVAHRAAHVTGTMRARPLW